MAVPGTDTILQSRKTYNESNPVGTEILVNNAGCDSTVMINLNFSPAITTTETYAGCEGDGYNVIVNGNTYDELTPTGTELMTGSNGCDSIILINLKFAAPGFGDETLRVI